LSPGRKNEHLAANGVPEGSDGPLRSRSSHHDVIKVPARQVGDVIGEQAKLDLDDLAQGFDRELMAGAIPLRGLALDAGVELGDE
jgi:hypothetical protein